MTPAIPIPLLTDHQKEMAANFRQAATNILRLDFSPMVQRTSNQGGHITLATELAQYQRRLEFVCSCQIEYSSDRLLTEIPREQSRIVSSIDPLLAAFRSNRIPAHDPEMQNWIASVGRQLPEMARNLSQILHESIVDRDSVNTLIGNALASSRGQLAIDLESLKTATAAAVKASSEAEKAMEQIGNAQTSLKTQEQKFDAIMAQTHKKLQDLAIAVESRAFGTAARSHQKAFIFWICAAAVWFAFLLLFVNWQFFSDGWDKQSTGTGEVLRRAIPRIVLFLLGSGILAWLLRAALAERHNEIVNQHRGNALATFTTFVDGTTSTQIREAILLRATDAIFAPQSTGFNKDDGGSGDSGRIVELIRDVGKSSGKDT